MRKHQREVADYLRDEYGANDIRIEPGGKHPKLVFNYQDKEHSLPLGNPSDYRAIKNLHTDLKKKLGEPITDTRRQARKLEDMMAELNSSTSITPRISLPAQIEESAPATKTWTLRMSAYKSSKSTSVVWFIFPKGMMNEYPNGMKIERLDDEHWKISPGGTKQFHEYANHARIIYNDRIPVFGSCKAEAIEEAGEILVFLAKDNRRMVNSPAPFAEIANRKSAPTPAIPDTRGPKLPHEGMPIAPESPPQPVPPMSGLAMEVQMRSFIRGAREIEAMTPYRVTRMPDGRLVWQAPVIE